MTAAEDLSFHLGGLIPPSDLDGALRLVEAAGFGGVALDMAHLGAEGPRGAARLVRDRGLAVTSLGGAGRFTAREREQRRAGRDANLRALETALATGAGCLALVPGGLPKGSRDLEGSRHSVRDGLGELLEDAASAGVRLALAPDHPLLAATRSVVCTLGEALDLAAELGHDGLGVLVDLHRHWWDAGLGDAVTRAVKERRLFAVRLGDWMADRENPLTSRGLPGQGVIAFTPFLRLLNGTDYAGPLELHVTPGQDPLRQNPRDLPHLAAEAAARHLEA